MMLVIDSQGHRLRGWQRALQTSTTGYRGGCITSGFTYCGTMGCNRQSRCIENGDMPNKQTMGQDKIFVGMWNLFMRDSLGHPQGVCARGLG